VKTLGISPFTAQEMGLLDSLKEQYVVRCLISPRGILKEGCDIGILKNQRKLGYSVINDTEEIHNVDVVIIPQVPKEKKALHDFAMRTLHYSVACGKEVFCFLQLEDEIKSRLQRSSSRHGSTLHLHELEPDIYGGAYSDRKLRKFNAPVLYISESIPGADGYETFLSVKSNLEHLGLRVLALSEDIYNSIFGAHYIQLNGNGKAEEQIFRLNYIVQQLEYKTHPDILLIKMPKPMVQYDETLPFDSGGVDYLISQAIPGDGCIYCSHTTFLENEYWKRLSETIRMRFGYPILGVHMSNMILDQAQTVGVGITYLPENEIIETLKAAEMNDEISFFNLHDRTSLHKFVSDLVKQLIEIPFGVIN